MVYAPGSFESMKFLSFWEKRQQAMAEGYRLGGVLSGLSPYWPMRILNHERFKRITE
jgi:hypothetical protein